MKDKKDLGQEFNELFISELEKIFPEKASKEGGFTIFVPMMVEILEFIENKLTPNKS